VQTIQVFGNRINLKCLTKTDIGTAEHSWHSEGQVWWNWTDVLQYVTL